MVLVLEPVGPKFLGARLQPGLSHLKLLDVNS